MRSVVAVLALLSVGAAGAPGDSVGLKASSWGRLIREWRVDAKGDGTLREGSESGAPVIGSNSAVTTRAVHLGPAGYAKLRHLLAPVETAARQKYECKVTITDMVYGGVYFATGGRALTYAFNDGCTAARDKKLQQAIRAADQIVKDAAKGAAVPDKLPLTPLNKER